MEKIHRKTIWSFNWICAGISNQSVNLVKKRRYSVLHTARKDSYYRVFSGPYFPTLGLKIEIYFVNLPIQSKCGKIRTGKNFVFGHISNSGSPLHFYSIRKNIENKNLNQPIKCQCCPHTETSQMICRANQLTGFYMGATLAFNGLTYDEIIL